MLPAALSAVSRLRTRPGATAPRILRMPSPLESNGPAVARQLERLAAQIVRLERTADLPDDDLLRALPERSGWSPAQHLFHVLLANEMSLKNAAALVARKGMLIRPFGALAEGAAAVLASGRIPLGAEAPRFVRPRGTVDLGFVRDLVRSTREQLEALDAGAVASAPDCIPHQVLGDLDAGQWIRFARMHSAHHLGIVRGLLRA